MGNERGCKRTESFFVFILFVGCKRNGSCSKTSIKSRIRSFGRWWFQPRDGEIFYSCPVPAPTQHTCLNSISYRERFFFPFLLFLTSKREEVWVASNFGIEFESKRMEMERRNAREKLKHAKSCIKDNDHEWNLTTFLYCCCCLLELLCWLLFSSQIRRRRRRKISALRFVEMANMKIFPTQLYLRRSLTSLEYSIRLLVAYDFIRFRVPTSCMI